MPFLRTMALCQSAMYSFDISFRWPKLFLFFRHCNTSFCCDVSFYCIFDFFSRNSFWIPGEKNQVIKMSTRFSTARIWPLKIVGKCTAVWISDKREKPSEILIIKHKDPFKMLSTIYPKSRFCTKLHTPPFPRVFQAFSGCLSEKQKTGPVNLSTQNAILCFGFAMYLSCS